MQIIRLLQSGCHIPENEKTSEEWCGRGESNPHALRRWNLNPVRLPVPPRPRSVAAFGPSWRSGQPRGAGGGVCHVFNCASKCLRPWRNRGKVTGFLAKTVKFTGNMSQILFEWG